MIILLSGMGSGPKEEIQAQLSVGVGTLVGSTVMLLTVPWGVAVMLGQRYMTCAAYYLRSAVLISAIVAVMCFVLFAVRTIQKLVKLVSVRTRNHFSKSHSSTYLTHALAPHCLE
jgi:hypothetical protein